MPVQELARYCLDSSVQLVSKSQPKSLVDVLRECYDQSEAADLLLVNYMSGGLLNIPALKADLQNKTPTT